jgi:hypothetical protein
MAMTIFNSIPYDFNNVRLVDLFISGIEVGKRFESFSKQEQEFITNIYKF